MKGLRDVEYLPEPTDRSIVSAVDPTVIGFQNEWRSEIMGWAPQEVTPVVRPKRRTFTVSGMVVFALLVSASLLFWQNNWIVVEFQVPKSEWAFEDSELRTLQQEGLTGQDVRVCMVDTGIDATHEAFGGREIEFKDLVGSSRAPLDYGAVAHGTLMAGLLLSTDHQEGAAPGVTFAMVASLSDNGDGENTGLDSNVADAIRWCQFEFEADIISLSLGGSENADSQEGGSSSATRQATDAGIYVIAAAGNDGTDDDGDVASPGSVQLAISVGATTQGKTLWANSSSGAPLDRNGEPRESPHLKPEVVAPGEFIISTGNDNRWYSSSGTSDATVFVTGALALILEGNPLLKPTSGGNASCLVKVKEALMNSLRIDGVSEHDARGGYGMLNAEAWYQETQLISAC
ncbi:MAG: S8 family serine peptidase [Candidatus Poseidoniales archaeon]|jgi:subtilisin family serine protease